MRTLLSPALLVGLVLLGTACEDAGEPALGDLRVAVATDGDDLDIDGYLVVVGRDTLGITVNGSRTYFDLPTGTHEVALSGLASNCSASGDNPRQVSVTGDVMATVLFFVRCVGTGMVVASSTTGIDIDPDGYSVTVDGPDSATALGLKWRVEANGVVRITRLPPGSYRVTLGELASNCAARAGNPLTVTVTFGVVTAVPFSTTCVAATARIEVTLTTSGTDLDANGYTVDVGGTTRRAVAVNGNAVFEALPGGDHSVRLTNVATNCSVVGENPRTLSLTVGGTTRHTARTRFAVTCAFAPSKVAFSRAAESGAALAVAHGDSTNIALIGWGIDPAWSPTGTHIAFTGYTCDDYEGCGTYGLFVIESVGSEVTRLTGEASDGEAAWHPDGSLLAFTRSSSIVGVRPVGVYVMNADGSGIRAVPLPGGVKRASQAAWSPDGSTLAFVCEFEDGNRDICVAHPDGTGLLRLTSTPGPDVGPAWKPDGSALAFATRRYSGVHEIAVMNSDGTGVTRLTTGTGAIYPAWSNDGTKLAFSGFACDVDSGCAMLGLFVMNADGSGLAQLTRGNDTAPSWRP